MRAYQFDAGTKARRVICELESDSRGMFERCFVIFFKLGQRKRTQVDSALDESDIVRIRRISYKREIMCESDIRKSHSPYWNCIDSTWK